MKKVCVVGHFGFGDNMLNGQTIKTKNVTAELEKQLGAEQVTTIDTHGGAKALPRVFIQLLSAFKSSKNIIILPAHNGIKIFVPLCTAMNKIFRRKLHYVVIGGWLNDLLNEHKRIENQLQQFSGIYVETNAMKKLLNNREFDNIEVMPNFKDIKILSDEELVYSTEEPYRLCTFSRVMKQKGIGEAIEAVKTLNDKYGREIFTLDIFGQIDSEQTEWFETLKIKFPQFVQYKGLVPFDQSVAVLKDYYALLFPTYYDGEGFAGTLLDAMAAGVPAIVTDWKYNSEIVVPGKTGVLIEPHNQESLNKAVEQSLGSSWNTMKSECTKEAKRYVPEKMIRVLLKHLG